MRPTAALFSINVRRNVQLTTKQTGKGYYKGTGVKNLGSWDKLVPRKWIPDYNKIRTYVYPVTGIQDCQLTPFVGESVGKYVQQDDETWEKPKEKMTGQDYLDLWIGFGGNDEPIDAGDPRNPSKRQKAVQEEEEEEEQGVRQEQNL